MIPDDEFTEGDYKSALLHLLLNYGLLRYFPDKTPLPTITHDACERLAGRQTEAGSLLEPGEYGTLVISGDQETKNATDLVVCKCTRCGKEFLITASYLEALLASNDLDAWKKIVFPEDEPRTSKDRLLSVTPEADE